MITVLLLYKYVKFHVFNLLETEISVLWIQHSIHNTQYCVSPAQYPLAGHSFNRKNECNAPHVQMIFFYVQNFSVLSPLLHSGIYKGHLT